MLSQLVAAPVMITSCALVGVVVTSASSQILNLEQGELIWNPIFLLSKYSPFKLSQTLMTGAIQTHYGDSSGVRAAVFFAGLGCTCAQLSINVILNAVSTGMVLAGFAPKYINIKRGAVLLGMFGLAVNPWQLTATASTFIGVISGFGIFIGETIFFSHGNMLTSSSNDWYNAMRLSHHSSTTSRDSRSVYWRLILDILVSPRIPLAYDLGLPSRFRTPLPGIHHESPRKSHYIRMGQVIPNHLPCRIRYRICQFLDHLYNLTSSSL